MLHRSRNRTTFRGFSARSVVTPVLAGSWPNTGQSAAGANALTDNTAQFRESAKTSLHEVLLSAAWVCITQTSRFSASLPVTQYNGSGTCTAGAHCMESFTRARGMLYLANVCELALY